MSVRGLGPIDHVAVVVRDIEEALPRYAALFGLAAPEGVRRIGAQGVRLCFLPTGPAPAARIELIQPTDPDSGVARFLEARGEGLHHVCFETPAVDDALMLGVALAELARAGRDKVTFDVAPRFRSFGAWAEQLLAESTGKEGTGLIPVEGEPLANAEMYGDDRVFVRIVEPGWHADAGAPLAEAGHPVLTLTVSAPQDLGALFFVWEFATAAAGWRPRSGLP